MVVFMEPSSIPLYPTEFDDDLKGPNPPIHLNATYYSDQRVAYGRETNPTWEALEVVLGKLEGGHATVFSSGQGALHSVLGATRRGQRCFLAHDTYNGTRRLADFLAERQRLELVLVEPDSLASGEYLLGGASKGDLILFETPSNPALRIFDIAAIAQKAQSHGLVSVVDNTFASPILQRPIELGVDVVVHSTTKLISGHSDALGGAIVVKRSEEAEEFRLRRTLFGSIPGPVETYLTYRGLKTLDLRVRHSSGAAQRVAETLVGSLGEESVRYPGLLGHEGHEIAARQMSGFGSIVTVDLGDQQTADHFVSALQYFHGATSLGGVESLIERRARHRYEERTPPGLLRLSIGLEAIDDLLEDLQRAVSATFS
jgi:cystathionine beta-lyase/cystathionine gamma-synthase